MEKGMSLKEIFQGMNTGDAELMLGTVTQAKPLRITMENDEKLVITDRITIVPRHLTDYKTTATFELGAGSIVSYTEGDGTHTHHLVSFKLAKGTITVHNALKLGEKVHVLSLCKGKLYYVLDRSEAEDE